MHLKFIGFFVHSLVLLYSTYRHYKLNKSCQLFSKCLDVLPLFTSPEPARSSFQLEETEHMSRRLGVIHFFDHMRNMEDPPPSEVWEVANLRYPPLESFLSVHFRAEVWEAANLRTDPPLEGFPSIHFRAEVWEAANLRRPPLESRPSVHFRESWNLNAFLPCERGVTIPPPPTPENRDKLLREKIAN